MIRSKVIAVASSVALLGGGGAAALLGTGSANAADAPLNVNVEIAQTSTLSLSTSSLTFSGAVGQTTGTAAPQSVTATIQDNSATAWHLTTQAETGSFFDPTQQIAFPDSDITVSNSNTSYPLSNSATADASAVGAASVTDTYSFGAAGLPNEPQNTYTNVVDYVLTP